MNLLSHIAPRDTWMDLDQVFNSFFTPSRLIGGDEKQFFTPSVDIIDRNDRFEIKADLPGVKKENVKVSMDNGMLTIEADQQEEKIQEKDGRIIRQERRAGHFMRTMSLGNNVHEKDIRASFKDGVLSVEVPKLKKEESKARLIAIE